MTTAPTEGPSAAERTLESVGSQQMVAQRIYDPARKYIRDTANRDDSELYRGRNNADVMQTIGAGPESAVAAGENIATLGARRTAVSDAVRTAMTEGSHRGLASRDANIKTAVGMDLGMAGSSARAASVLAKQQADEATQKAQIALQRSMNKASAGVAIGGVAANAYAGNQDDALFQEWTKQKKAGTMTDDWDTYRSKNMTSGHKFSDFLSRAI